MTCRTTLNQQITTVRFLRNWENRPRKRGRYLPQRVEDLDISVKPGTSTLDPKLRHGLTISRLIPLVLGGYMELDAQRKAELVRLPAIRSCPVVALRLLYSFRLGILCFPPTLLLSASPSPQLFAPPL